MRVGLDDQVNDQKENLGTRQAESRMGAEESCLNEDMAN